MKLGIRAGFADKRSSFPLLLAFVYCLGMVIPSATAIAAKKPCVTITDIKREVQEGWRQTYTFQGETIAINVAIEVPDADAVPALRVRCVGDLQPSGAPEKAEIYREPQEGFLYIIESHPGAIFGANTKGRFRWLQNYSDTALAENSPFSREEALAFLQKTIAPYVQACGSFAYEVRKMYVESRGYKVIKSDSSGETLDYGTTCTEMGVYQIVFNQVFHGIPYLALSLPFTWPLKVEEGLMLAVGEIRAAVASETDYALAFHPVVEDAVLAQDIPLTPFADVKAAVEQLIESGYLRNVYSVRLEYCFFNNPDDLHNTFILLPVWEVNGVYVQSPKDPTPTARFGDRATEIAYGGMPGYFNAQTGKYLDPEDQTQTRSFGTYLSWDDVK